MMFVLIIFNFGIFGNGLCFCSDLSLLAVDKQPETVIAAVAVLVVVVVGEAVAIAEHL